MRKIIIPFAICLAFFSACHDNCDIDWVDPQLSVHLYQKMDDGKNFNLLDENKFYKLEEIKVEFLGNFWKIEDTWSHLTVKKDENGNYLNFIIPGHKQYNDDIIFHWNENQKDTLHIKRTIKGHKSHTYWSKNANEFSSNINANYDFYKK